MTIRYRDDLDNILSDVKKMRLAGLPARKIASELDRRGYKKPSPTVAWQTHHVLQLLEELRKRGELPKRGQFKERFQQLEQEPACHFPKY
jgi:hypothetical protein